MCKCYLRWYRVIISVFLLMAVALSLTWPIVLVYTMLYVGESEGESGNKQYNAQLPPHAAMLCYGMLSAMGLAVCAASSAELCQRAAERFSFADHATEVLRSVASDELTNIIADDLRPVVTSYLAIDVQPHPPLLGIGQAHYANAR
jgi:hypothetical protein